jgi:hypothetical protein
LNIKQEKTMSIQEIKIEVSKLNKAQQAELMHFMIELLATDNFILSEDWKVELDRREKALDDGTSVGRPAKEVIAKYTAN